MFCQRCVRLTGGNMLYSVGLERRPFSCHPGYHLPHTCQSRPMSDSGLSNRLRQHSRRSGLGVGLTMAAAIAICILAAAWIFGQLEPYVGDIAGYDEPTATEVPEVAAVTADAGATSDSSSNPPGTEVPSTGATNAQPTVASATVQTPTPAAVFEATHRSNPDFTINFRPGPSVSSGDPVSSLPPGTPLKFLDEQALDEEGSIWLKMETENGTQGWLREVDTQVIIT